MSETDTPDPVSTIAHQDISDETPSVKVVAYYLASAGAQTYSEIVTETGLSLSSVSGACDTLEQRGLVTQEPRVTDVRGRNPTVVFPDELAFEPGDSDRDLFARMIEAAARAHWHRGLSSVTTAWLAEQAGATPQAVGAQLHHQDDDGPFECLNPEASGTGRYRLVGAGEYAPFWGDSS